MNRVPDIHSEVHRSKPLTLYDVDNGNSGRRGPSGDKSIIENAQTTPKALPSYFESSTPMKSSSFEGNKGTEI